MREAPARGLLVPSLIAVIGVAILLGLGFWQVERKAWKENLIAQLEERMKAAPSDLPPPQRWETLAQDLNEFRRVKVRVDFLDGARPAWVYVSGSALRDDIKAPGYFMFQPARLPGGQVVAVNRGYSPERNAPPARGTQEVTGYLRWPQAPSIFVSEHDASKEVWFVRDPRAMAQALQWGEVAPFYVAQESPVPAGGLPRPGALKVNLSNNHLGYALTWFGLAAGLVAVFTAWAWNRRRGARNPASL